MNALQADKIVGMIRDAGAYQELPDDQVKRLTEWLIPLPFDVCERRVEQWAAAAPEPGRAEKWTSTPDHILAAVGVGAAARPLLAQAKAEGRELWPSLRGVGWEFAWCDGKLPQGVGEFYANLCLPIPDGRAVTLVLPVSITGHGPGPALASVALAHIASGLAERKDVALRRAIAERQHPAPPPALPDRATWPPVLREAVEAAEAAHDQAARAEQRCLAQERAYREMCDALDQRIRDGAPDLETAKAVAAELLERIAADPLGGWAACVEVFHAGVAPHLSIDLKQTRVDRGPQTDAFEDAPGPIVGMRVLLKRKD